MMRRVAHRQQCLQYGARTLSLCAVRFAKAKPPPVTRPPLTPDFFPYGSADFREIRHKNQFWCDNSKYIHDIVEGGADHQLFLRPPRWGKSLFMDMLRCCLDVNMKKDFDKLFKGTDIHKRKKELRHRNKYHVMKFDFSVQVRSNAAPADIEQEFDKEIRNAEKDFCRRYNMDWSEINDPASTLGTMKDVIRTTINTKQNAKVFLLIDEYDRFANKLMFENPTAYDKVVAGVSGDKYLSPIRSFFEAVKSMKVRSFTTGLLPIALADVGSGANNIRFITQDPRFANMLGFTAADVERGLKMLFDEADVPKALDTARRFFNGYRFPYQLWRKPGEALYTPQFCLRFFRKCCDPAFRIKVVDGSATLADMSDPNSKVSSNIVPLLAKHSELPLVLASMTTPQGVCGATVQESFKLNELTTGRTMDLPVSFMVWHGLLTRGDPNTDAKDGFVIPNDVVGDPTKDDGIMSQIYAGGERANIDALAVAQNPTEEGLWKLLTAALSQIATPFDNSVSEVAIQSVIELFIRYAGGSVDVEVEKVLDNKRRFDMCLTAKTGRRERLLIEFKRLHPASTKNTGDLKATRDDLHIPDCAASRKVLPSLQIHEAKTHLHGGAATIEELENKAMQQCQRYKEILSKDPTLPIRCATAIHATAVDTPGPSARYTSAFLVSVEPGAKPKKEAKSDE